MSDLNVMDYALLRARDTDPDTSHDAAASMSDETTCNECGHVRRIYKRRLPKADLDTLSQLYGKDQSGDREWFHIREIKRHKSGCGFAKFRYWGLIEESHNDDSEKKNAGYWRLTDHGRQFMAGEIKIRTHARIADAVCIGFAGGSVDVHQAYRMSGFSFSELMAPFNISTGRTAREWEWV